MASQLTWPHLLWTKRHDPKVLFAKDFTCPHCKMFSYFCFGNMRANNALDWIKSVTGFDSSTRTAVLDCNHCGVPFNLRLPESVVGFYKDHCPVWPQ